MARAPRVSVPPPPRANAPAPASRRGNAQTPVLKGATAVSTKPTEGQSRIKNGVRQVYKNGKWTNVGAVRPTRPSSPGGVPVAPRLAAPETAPATTTTTTTAFKPDANWWTQQFAADPRFAGTAGNLALREQQTAGTYGYRIRRVPTGQPGAGQPYFVSRSTGAAEIMQKLTPEGFPMLDDNGAPIYVDKDGKQYAAGDLDLSIEEIKRGEEGYLRGAFGAAAAGSEKRVFDIGDVAAQAGARRSGMRGQAVLSEGSALQDALRGLTLRAGGEFAGIRNEYADLYNKIFADLVEKAAAQPGTETTTTTPAPAPEAAPPAAPSGVTPVAGGGTVNPQGQYTPPAAGSVLSDRAFDNTLNEILGPPSQRGPQPMTKADRIRALRNVYDNYQLTPAQRRRVKAELKKLGFNVA